MKEKALYFIVGALVWGWVFFVIARYVVDVHSGAALAGLTTGAAILGGLSAAKDRRYNRYRRRQAQKDARW